MCRMPVAAARVVAFGFITIAAVVALRAADDAEKTKEVKAKDLTLKVPEAWKQKQGTSPLRAAEFQIAPTADDKEGADVVVFHFGAGQGGGVPENLDRWLKQFEATGRKSKVFSGESAAGKYTLIDLTGTFNKPVGPPIQQKTEPKSGWRVLNVLLEAPNGPYFLRLDGPEKTVTAAEAAFRASFGAKKDAEKEQKSP